MRVISGRFKGHKLVSFDEDHIRPTTDRVKESLFNIVGPIDGFQVLDLYSGTGNLGIEALSRGASQVDMVEINSRSVSIIRKNLERLKITEGIQIFKTAAIDYLKKYQNKPYDLILIDPPFPLKICEKTLEALSTSPAAGTASQIAIEHSKQEPVSPEIGLLSAVDTRSYGDKLVTFYRKR